MVLALGSTAPGLLGFFINKFSAIFPDYRERVLRHEAAHLLVHLDPRFSIWGSEGAREGLKRSSAVLQKMGFGGEGGGYTEYRVGRQSGQEGSRDGRHQSQPGL